MLKMFAQEVLIIKLVKISSKVKTKKNAMLTILVPYADDGNPDIALHRVHMYYATLSHLDIVGRMSEPFFVEHSPRLV